MTYHFMHYFSVALTGAYNGYLSDERKIEIAKKKAAEDLAKKLLENAVFKVNQHGDVEGIIEVP